MAGKLIEDLAVGQVFQHQPGRTVTEADNVFFSCLTIGIGFLLPVADHNRLVVVLASR